MEVMKTLSGSTSRIQCSFWFFPAPAMAPAEQAFGFTGMRGSLTKNCFLYGYGLHVHIFKFAHLHILQ